MASLFFRLAGSATLTNTLDFFCSVVNVVLAGRMGNITFIAAVGLTDSITTMMITSVILGINSAQMTLTSQAFGYGDKRLCGVLLNRGRFILTLFIIPFAVVPLFFGERIILVLGQDPDVARWT